MPTHLFGNPAILLVRTRGFASPDCSGFARSENVLKLRSNQRTPRTALWNKKTRAIADVSADSAGFTCPVGMRLTALSYLTLGRKNSPRPELLQAFLLRHIAHPVIGNIYRHLETRRGEQADLLQALGQLSLPIRVKVRFSYYILHGYPSYTDKKRALSSSEDKSAP